MILNHDSQLRAPHTPRLSDLGTAQLKINLSPSQMKITIEYVVIKSLKYIMNLIQSVDKQEILLLFPILSVYMNEEKKQFK